MTLHLVKPEVKQKLTNAELWLEIITLCQDANEERRKEYAKLLDEHFVIYSRGKGGRPT